MKTKDIAIEGKVYTMKHCVRSRMLFETITGKMWSLSTLTDQYVYFYAMIMAGTKDCGLQYDEFLDAMDADPSLFVEYSNYLHDSLEREAAFSKKSEEGGKN